MINALSDRPGDSSLSHVIRGGARFVRIWSVWGIYRSHVSVCIDAIIQMGAEMA